MLDDPAAIGTGAGAEAQLARAMQGAAIPIMETPPERTWIWSDLHLADRSILLVWNRPFWSIEEMNRHLLTRWSERVGAGDTIICLGDVGHPDAWRDRRLVVSTYATVPASGCSSSATTMSTTPRRCSRPASPSCARRRCARPSRHWR